MVSAFDSNNKIKPININIAVLKAWGLNIFFAENVTEWLCTVN